jgi:EAL domain-containing protein (putative c-di-GMP-specific phosphodiesterase class I)
MGNENLALHCSIGIALYPSHGESSDALLSHADVAMYSAKEMGGQRYVLYSERLTGDFKESLRLHSALNEALRRNEFELYYQPKIHTLSGRLSGAEALIRWHSPGLGVISPGAFIPFAEQSGLIWQIGNWVLNTACRQNKEWQRQGLPPIRISVNVSMTQLEHPDFLKAVQVVLEETELDPKWLELEVTESVLVKNLDRAASVIDDIARLGVEVSVDDFGVGYSSLQYLSRMRVGTLKIDQSFIHSLGTLPTVTDIITSIVNMAHRLEMRVVAEGVERNEQLEILTASQCDEIQGFLILRPQPKDTFEQYYRHATSFNRPDANS